MRSRRTPSSVGEGTGESCQRENLLQAQKHLSIADLSNILELETLESTYAECKESHEQELSEVKVLLEEDT